MTELVWFIFKLFACIFFINVSIIVTVATTYIASRLLGFAIDDFLDYKILWDNRKDLAKLPDKEESEWQ